GEAGGLHFLSMEYIDGEDLSGLLKRIGRLPRDKAVELARQICAGLGAAHEAGVLHRDMKPANVMVDGKGRAKITDFGLAQVAEELQSQDVFAGTPAYMAPEQITSGEVSVRTDLYALGLVLYEMFTGQRAFPDEDWRQLMERGGHGEISRPSSHVEGLDPLVERVVMRCLEEEPADRPSSALEVSAALPGGDPLAAALAAGETPSPEMVAAAPRKGTLTPAVGAALLAVAVLGFFANLWASDRFLHLAASEVDKRPEVMAEKARELLRSLGHQDLDNPDSKGNYDTSWRYLTHLRRTSTMAQTRRLLGQRPPAAIHYWYRESPRPLVPTRRGRFYVSSGDPPLVEPGMRRVVLDPDGRLVALRVLVEDATSRLSPSPEPAWSSLFEQAGLDFGRFAPEPPSSVAPLRADLWRAWKGSRPAGVEIHVEAAAEGGRVVLFEILEPWSEVTNALGGPGDAPIWVVFCIVLAGGAALARHNLRLGRGDRDGARRLAVAIVGLVLASWILRAQHFSGPAELSLFLEALATALYRAFVVVLLYLALEPLVRRRWPTSMVAWTRLLAGRWRDPLVGRDVLVGCALVGVLMVPFKALARLPRGPLAGVYRLESVWNGIGNFLGWTIFLSILVSLGLLFFFFFAFRLLRRKWLVGLVLCLPLILAGLIARFFEAAFAAVMILTIMRLGLLTVVCSFAMYELYLYWPLTADTSAWYFDHTLAVGALVIGLSFYGFRTAVAGRPLVPSALLEDPSEFRGREKRK
ncbi:MAG: serine/threonine protein kinase, partial [bacterium]|nr:serine/threonine protein kinase [bacterium]